jgi:hypothetical protein
MKSVERAIWTENENEHDPPDLANDHFLTYVSTPEVGSATNDLGARVTAFRSRSLKIHCHCESDEYHWRWGVGAGGLGRGGLWSANEIALGYDIHFDDQDGSSDYPEPAGKIYDHDHNQTHEREYSY